MRRRALLVLIAAVALAGCGADPNPTATPTIAAETAAPIEHAAPICTDGDEAECADVLAAAVRQLGRGQSAFIGPGTVTSVQCEAVPEWANPARCWSVWLPMRGWGPAHLIMVRRLDGVIGQIGGDPVSGAAISPGDEPPLWWYGSDAAD